MIRSLEPHEAANIFPPMTDDEYIALRADIKANGLREPIWLFDGKIIDGRNRYRACQELDVEPEIRNWQGNGNGDLTAFVVSLNLHRRHLTESQRAMIAARIKPRFEAEAKEHQGHGKTAPGRRTNDSDGGTLLADLPKALDDAKPIHSRDKAAELLNTSSRLVGAAETVQTKGTPELVQAVEKGEVKVSAAAVVARLPAEEQDRLMSEGPKAVKEKAKEVRESRARAERESSEADYTTTDRTEDDNEFQLSPPEDDDEPLTDEGRARNWLSQLDRLKDHIDILIRALRQNNGLIKIASKQPKATARTAIAKLGELKGSADQLISELRRAV